MKLVSVNVYFVFSRIFCSKQATICERSHKSNDLGAFTVELYASSSKEDYLSMLTIFKFKDGNQTSHFRGMSR